MRCDRFGGWIVMLSVVAALVLGTASWSLAEDPPTNKDADGEKVRVLIVYHSLSGNTERMARGVAVGVKRVPGAVAIVKKIDDVKKQDLVDADGIILGSPAYFANIAGKMKLAIDDWNWKLKVDFTDKVGGAFATGGGQTGGKEHVVISLLLFMLNNRMIVVGPLYEDEEGDDIWGELGASAMTGPLDPGVGAHELDAAGRLGQRVAQVAKKVKGK